MKTAPLRHCIFGLFEKRIPGDDCLLRLAQARFQRAGMGAEFHAGTPGQLDGLLPFRPSSSAMVHLPRHLDWAEPEGQQLILDFAARHAGDVGGLIVHDMAKMKCDQKGCLAAARELNGRLEAIPQAPALFVEYASGLNPASFAGFFEAASSLGRISACIDTGHVGIWQIRQAYSLGHPGRDICDLKCQPDKMMGAIEDIRESVETALPAVLGLIRQVGAFGKPVHFHLHDGHPLSLASPFGVADHLSFLSDIPIASEYRGSRTVRPMFGPEGLRWIAGAVADAAGQATFTFEIHPSLQRLELGEFLPLFAHWRDKTNAEQMNHWLWTLEQNHTLLLSLMNPQPLSSIPRAIAC